MTTYNKISQHESIRKLLKEQETQPKSRSPTGVRYDPKAGLQREKRANAQPSRLAAQLAQQHRQSVIRAVLSTHGFAQGLAQADAMLTGSLFDWAEKVEVLAL